MFASVPELTAFQFSMVDNVFSMTVAAMGAAAIFFFSARGTIASKYQPAVMASGVVVAIACYHYFMIRQSWQGAFVVESGMYKPSGRSFNDFYRYADWILTVPLLLVELVAVLALAREIARPLLGRLVVAAALMIGLGYPGEVISDPAQGTARMIWGLASCVPFAYILYVLWVELGKAIDTEPAVVRSQLALARILLVATWLVYPIAYFLGGTPEALAAKAGSGGSASGVVMLQIGYAIADITAKAGFGLLIYFIARTKTEILGANEPSLSMSAAAAS